MNYTFIIDYYYSLNNNSTLISIGQVVELLRILGNKIDIYIPNKYLPKPTTELSMDGNQINCDKSEDILKSTISNSNCINLISQEEISRMIEYGESDNHTNKHYCISDNIDSKYFFPLIKSLIELAYNLDIKLENALVGNKLIRNIENNEPNLQPFATTQFRQDKTNNSENSSIAELIALAKLVHKRIAIKTIVLTDSITYDHIKDAINYPEYIEIINCSGPLNSSLKYYLKNQFHYQFGLEPIPYPILLNNSSKYCISDQNKDLFAVNIMENNQNTMISNVDHLGYNILKRNGTIHTVISEKMFNFSNKKQRHISTENFGYYYDYLDFYLQTLKSPNPEKKK